MMVRDAIANDACPACGTRMRPSRATLRCPVNGDSIRVAGVPHFACPKCGERLIGYEEAGLLEARAHASYRAKFGLLDPTEIRALRRKYRLTQAQLARLLRFGANTVSRWESGRNVQTAAMDVLLRLLRDLPGSFAYLRRRAV